MARCGALVCFILNNCGGVTFVMSCHVTLSPKALSCFATLIYVLFCFDAHVTSAKRTPLQKLTAESVGVRM